jgi:hypothetical protein
MPIPQFGTLRPDIDAKLEAIIQKALSATATSATSPPEMLTDLELYLYSDRYGPTNEKLGVYLGAFGPAEPAPRRFRSPPPLR